MDEHERIQRVLEGYCLECGAQDEHKIFCSKSTHPYHQLIMYWNYSYEDYEWDCSFTPNQIDEDISDALWGDSDTDGDIYP